MKDFSGRIAVVTGGGSGMGRELVHQLVAEGCAVKTIASRLNISVKTVEFHKTRLMRRLGKHGTAELTRFAVASGLISI